MATKAKCPSGYTLKNGKCIGKDGKEVAAPYVSESGAFYPDQESLTSGCAKNPNSPKCQKVIGSMTPEQRAKIKGIQKLGGVTKKYEAGGMTDTQTCGGPGKPKCRKKFKSKGKSKETKGSLLGTIGAGLLGGLGGYAAYKKLKEQKKGGITKYNNGGIANLKEATITAKKKTYNNGDAASSKVRPVDDKTTKQASKYKTGGMVNANAKLQAAKSAGSKGVKSGVNPRAAASNTAKKPSKPRSKAPKKATPGRG
jgi:hypothetical protein